MTTSSDSTTSSSGAVRAEPGTVIVFTPQGLADLDRLAATLTAGCDHDTPAAIAGVLEQVLHAPLDDLAAALTSDPRVDWTGRPLTVATPPAGPAPAG
jgi:hypothetical protein